RLAPDGRMGPVVVAATAPVATVGRAADAVRGVAGVARDGAGVAGSAGVGQREGRTRGPGIARSAGVAGIAGTNVEPGRVARALDGGVHAGGVDLDPARVPRLAGVAGLGRTA